MAGQHCAWRATPGAARWRGGGGGGSSGCAGDACRRPACLHASVPLLTPSARPVSVMAACRGTSMRQTGTRGTTEEKLVCLCGCMCSSRQRVHWHERLLACRHSVAAPTPRGSGACHKVLSRVGGRSRHMLLAWGRGMPALRAPPAKEHGIDWNQQEGMQTRVGRNECFGFVKVYLPMVLYSCACTRALVLVRLYSCAKLLWPNC